MSRKSYQGQNVIVSFDPDVCQHSGNCVRGLPAVFDTKRAPWIDPDAAPADDIIAQVGRCPSGALRIEQPGAET
jgi:uncharacterized Fe-S cluster protein YjdI